MRWVINAALVAGALAATPALANEKRDFEWCDGLPHPGKQDDGMRGQIGSGALRFAPVAEGQLSACTRALASPRLLPTQTLRRAHLLRARAATYLREGNTTAALADLDAAQESTRALANDRFFGRSMGVSFTLLRALARAMNDDAAGAATLARDAMQARPYAVEVQQVGATILQFNRTPGSETPFAALMRLEPEAGTLALLREAEAGNYAAVVRMRAGVTPDWPNERLAPFAIAVNAPEAGRLLGTMLTSLDVAYARAATGDPAGARRDLAEVRTRVAALQPLPSTQGSVQVADPAAALTGFIDARARQIDARIAVAEGRTDAAIAALVAAPMPRNAATVELLTALKTALPADKAALVPDIAPFTAAAAEARKATLKRAIPAALIVPETPRAVIDYDRARPNILGAMVGAALSMGTSLLGGVERTNGFRSTTNADGTVSVEFLGNTPSPSLVQEMTLLRAAEVTRAASKPAFTIVKRQDFSRRLTQTQYGREISSTPTGFKTILTIRYVDPAADPARALDPVRVIDALGPLYYEEKKTA